MTARAWAAMLRRKPQTDNEVSMPPPEHTELAGKRPSRDRPAARERGGKH